MRAIGTWAIAFCVAIVGIWVVDTWDIKPLWAFVAGVIASGINRALQKLNGDDE